MWLLLVPKNGQKNLYYFRKFLKQKFLAHNRNKNRRIEVFETTATNTELVKHILVSVQGIIIQQILHQVIG